jgi:hypothetical protein
MQEIKIEIVIRPKQIARSRSNAFCRICNLQVGLMTFTQAAHFCYSSPEKITELAERGKVHRIHNINGEIMICRNSLETNLKNVSKRILLNPLESGN